MMTVAVPQKVGDHVSQIYACCQAVVRTSASGLMVKTDRSDEICRKLPAFEQSRADFGVIDTEQLCFGFQQRGLTGPAFGEDQAVSVFQGLRQYNFADVMQKTSSKCHRFIVSLVSGQ